MATKQVTAFITHADISIYVKCPHCHAQMNEVTDREAIEPVFKNLKLGLTKSVMNCKKCEYPFGVQISNL